MNAKAARTRDAHDRRFEQTRHGERQAGQTPAAMFLEAFRSFGEAARVSLIRRSASGRLSNAGNLKGPEEVLSKVLRFVDENDRLAFDHDDYSARLVAADPGSRWAWLELLNPETDSHGHPEIES